MNYTDLQACIGRVQLKRQPEFQQIRRQIAQYYADALNYLNVLMKQLSIMPINGKISIIELVQQTTDVMQAARQIDDVIQTLIQQKN